MSNVKYLATAAAATLVAGTIPLMVLKSPAGALVGGVAIALSAVGFIVTMALYFKKESTAALTWKEEDFRWH